MAVIRAISKNNEKTSPEDGQTKSCSNCQGDGCRDCDGYGYFVYENDQYRTVDSLQEY